jgi:hypothetical protein
MASRSTDLLASPRAHKRRDLVSRKPLDRHVARSMYDGLDASGTMTMPRSEKQTKQK